MLLKMDTSILPLVNPGLYGTFLGGLYEDVPEEDGKEFEKLLCFSGKLVMNELLQDEDVIVNTLGEMEVNNVSFHSPQWYNYENDWFEFDLIAPDDIHKRIIDNLDDDFFKWIKENYCSCSGFISFMPYERNKYINAINDLFSRNFDRAVAMYIMYLVECGDMCYSQDIYQRDFEEEMSDVCLVNCWYSFADYEMEA